MRSREISKDHYCHNTIIANTGCAATKVLSNPAYFSRLSRQLLPDAGLFSAYQKQLWKIFCSALAHQTLPAAVLIFTSPENCNFH